MNMVKYKPGRSLIEWDFDSLLDRFFTHADDGAVRYPTVDVKENEDNFVVEAELPGVTEKEIDVKVENDLLTISSHREAEKEEKKEHYILRERRASAFSRSFTLPKNTNRDGIQAVFRNGVLTLTIPKTPEAKPKTIDVKTN